MTELNVDPSRFRYIELRGDGSKLPANSWGGYDQDFDDAEHVHTLDEVEMFPMENWGVVDVQDPPHGSFALLIFDIDIHKAPEEFDPDRVSIPTNTLVTRSQNGGFHVYYIISGCERGDLNESDFQMTADPGFDVDIRGSSVSHHVVAPREFPGVGGQYEIVNDESVRTEFEPRDAAESIRFDGEPLLEFSPGSGGVDYQFDVETEPPEEMPTCYHAGLELRKAAPDDHPNSHKVNVLTAACGLAAGYDPETVAGHFCGEWSPYDGGADLSDQETTEYQVQHIADGGYAPPSEGTLRDYGILNDGEHCDEDCPIDYHGPDVDDQPALDIVAEQERDVEAEAAAVVGDEPEAEADGGATATKSSGPSHPLSFRERVQRIVEDYQEDAIQKKTARDRIARELCDEWAFVQPEHEVRGWREALYVFNPDAGIYERRGEAKIEKELERAAGDFVTNQLVNEIVGKVRRRSIERGDHFQPDPNRLVVGNGILDLHTGELSPYTPQEYHRTKITVDWNPDAGDPEAIDDFLHDIVADDDVETLYRLIAHTLYREYIGQKAAMLIGSGSNGKSMFLSLVEEFIGQENTTGRELQDFADDQFALNNLRGKLANIATEIGEQELNDTTAFKKATGRDTVTAPVKYEEPVQFENYATLMFATNEMPVFGQDNHAIWRRWLYLDFPYTFDADDPQVKDPEPERVLKRRLFRDEEFEALLLRCQQEIQRWYEGEPLFADAMDAEEVREKMKQAAEPIYAFATSCLEFYDEEDTWEPKSRVRSCYQAFAEEEDLPRIPDNQFGERLMNLRDFKIEDGQRREGGERYRCYNYIELSARGRQLLGIDEPDEGDDQETVDGEFAQAKPKVLERLREMVEENDGEPVDRNGLVWSVAGVGKTRAEQALDSLKEVGDVYEHDGGLLPSDF